MREKEMQKIMQQDLAVPKKIHDSFEQGLEQIYHMDTEQEMVGSMEIGMEEQQIGETAGRRKAGEFWRGSRGFWRKAAVAAAVAVVLCILDASPQIYSFARDLFMHDMVTIGEKKVQDENMGLVKINDGVLTASKDEVSYFESLEEVGEKLGVSFLKSPMENQVTGKGRVIARQYEYGEVEIEDILFSYKDLSHIVFHEDGGVDWYMDTGDCYDISCRISFHTKKFQNDIYNHGYDDFSLIEEYETAGGFHAKIIGSTTRSEDGTLCKDLRALIAHNNMWYEYESQDCRLGNFKVFLDSLTA